MARNFGVTRQTNWHERAPVWPTWLMTFAIRVGIINPGEVPRIADDALCASRVRSRNNRHDWRCRSQSSAPRAAKSFCGIQFAAASVAVLSH